MLNKEQVNNLFAYNDVSGDLTWKTTNKLAGTVLKNGYRQISIYGKRYLSHHIVWLMFKGFLPAQLDHINRNKKDNRIENLRECSSAENMQNRPSLKNTSSPYKGARINKTTSKWRAVFTTKGKSYYLGEYTSEVNAALAYDKWAIQYETSFTFLNFPHLKEYWKELSKCKAGNIPLWKPPSTPHLVFSFPC